MSLPTISIDRTEITENGRLRFAVTLSAPSVDEITIGYKTVPGTGIATGPDYYARSGALTIAAGQSVGYVDVDTTNDYVDEVDESLWLELFNPTNAVFAGGEPTLRALGTILDDDGTGSNLALFVSSPTLVEGNSGQKVAVFEVHLSRPHSISPSPTGQPTAPPRPEATTPPRTAPLPSSPARRLRPWRSR